MPPFKYEAFVNPYIGSISELMGKGDEAKAQALLRIGEIQARAEEQRGQAWGNAVQGLSNMASKAITDYNSPEAKDRRENEKSKVAFNEMMRTPDTEVQSVRRVSDPGVQAQPADWLGKGTDEVSGVLPSKSFVPTITQTNKYKNMAAPGISGLDTWNVDAIMQGLAEKGVAPEQAFKYSQILDSANTRMEKHHASAVNLMQQDVYGILQYPTDMRLGAAEAAIKKYGNNGVFSAETLQGATRSLAAIKALPANQQAVAVSKFLLGMSGQQDVILNQNPGDVGRSTLTGERFSGPAAKAVPPNRDLFAAILGDPNSTAEQKASAQVSLDSLKPTPQANASTLSMVGYLGSLNIPGVTTSNAESLFNGLTNTQKAGYAGYVARQDNRPRDPVLTALAQARLDALYATTEDRTKFAALSPDIQTAFRSATIGKSPDVSKKLLADLTATTDPERQIQLMRSIAQRSLPVQAQVTMSGRMTALRQMEDIEDTLMALRNSKGGPVPEGLIGYGTEKLKNWFGKIGNAEYKELGAKLQTVLQSYRQSITGKAFSSEESREYKNLGITPETFQRDMKWTDATIRGFKDALQRQIVSDYANALGGDMEYANILANPRTRTKVTEY